jgi:hypothetical protein
MEDDEDPFVWKGRQQMWFAKQSHFPQKNKHVKQKLQLIRL